jgi:hypothetical protein
MAFYNFIISLDVLFPGGTAWTKKYDTNICGEVWMRKAETRNWGAVDSESLVIRHSPTELRGG